PEIQQRLRQALGRYRAEARDEATADAVAHCLQSYKRLHEQGRSHFISVGNLVWYAVKRVRSGRCVGSRLNSHEPLALYAQRRRGIRIEPLQTDNASAQDWISALAQDRRSTVLDHVAARLDVAAWLATLGPRTRQIAVDLARGGTTSEIARQYGVTGGRISQLRRELANSWSAFQREPRLGT